MSNAVNPNDAVRPGHQLQLAEHRGDLQRLGKLALPSRSVADDGDVIDLLEYWNVLKRRKVTVFMTMAVTVVVALVFTFLATPIYRAQTLIQINREEGKVLEFQDITAQESVFSRDFYETQYELLKSRSLARRVIDRLGLRTSDALGRSEEPTFFGELFGTFKGWLSADSSDSEKTREPDLETLLLRNLEVSPVRNSRLVRVSFDSPDAEEAAAVANAIAENYINMNLERRYKASSYAKTFLEERTQQVRANLEDSERRLVTYAREREIINLDDKLAILMQKMQEMSTELVRAESDRILAEAEYQEMAEEGRSSTVNVLDNQVIQKLKERKADLEAEFQEKLKVYKPGYPKMQQLQKRIAEINREIANESAFIAKSVKNNFEAKVRREAKIKMRVSEIKEEILALQDRSTDYQTLKREVETNRELYDGLLQRMKEVGVAAGIGTNNISIVDTAEVPRYPYRPSLPKNLAIAIALGLFGGVLLAFLFETLDDTIKSSEQLEKRVGVPVLGVIPAVDVKDRDDVDQNIALLSFKDPKSVLAEAYRSLRTSLIFATSEGAPKVTHFTSPSPGEGKTTSAVSTAITFAQTGNKVLLIDGDLRNPSLHKIFVLPNSEGLTNYLTSDVKPSEIAQATQVTRLFVITTGPLPPNPVELLSGGKMLDLLCLAQERFDYVIIDGPPVIGLADALVLANLAGATLFVIEAAGTRAGALDASVKRLRDANARILGCVLAKVGRAGSGYGYGYGYGYDYHYSYTYGGTEEQAALRK